MQLKPNQFYVLIVIVVTLLSVKVTASSSNSNNVKSLSHAIRGYPIGSVHSCKKIPQAAINYCGLDHSTAGVVSFLAPELTITVYNILKTVVSIPNIHNYDKCIKNIKQLYCNLIFPRCNITSNQIIFNTSNCFAATSGCPPLVDNVIRRTELCQNIPTGQYSLDTCVKPPKVHYHYCHNGPSVVSVPKYLLMDRFLIDIGAKYQINTLRLGGASEQCIQKFLNLMCHTTPFCSPDKKSLMTSVTKQMCYEAVDCLPKNLQIGLKGYYKCDQHPNASSHHIYIYPDADSVGKAHNAQLSMISMALLVITLTILHISLFS